MSNETDKLAQEALEKLEGHPIGETDIWQIHEPVVDDPRYLRGYIAGMRSAHEKSIQLLIRAIEDRVAPSLEP